MPGRFVGCSGTPLGGGIELDITEQLAEELEATRTLMSCAATDGDDWRRRHAKMRAGEKAFRTSMIAAVTAERLTVERAEDTMDTYR